jgi:predicted amidophosphoribosyltransferase
MPGFIDSARQKADQLKFELDKRSRINQVQRQIDEVNRQNAADLNQIGTTILDLHRQGHRPIAEVTGLCQGIIEREAQITDFQAKIAAIQQETMPQPQVIFAAPQFMPAPPSTTACPTCQSPVMVGVRFCPNCGQPMVAEPVIQLGAPCPNCGLPTASGAAFCGECGYHLEPVPASVPIAPRFAPEPHGVDQPPVEPPQPDAQEPITPPETIEAAQPIGVATDAPASPPIAPLPPLIPSADEIALPICPTCSAQQRRADARFCFICGQRMMETTVASRPNSAHLTGDRPA